MSEEKAKYNKRKASVESTRGMIPPQEIQAEESLLGTLLSWSTHIVMVADLLKPDIFYHEAHRIIAQAMIDLHVASKKVDVITVMSELRRNGNLEMIGGAFYLTELTNKSVQPTHIQDHVRIVYQAYLLREIIRTCQEKIVECYQRADPFDVIVSVANKMDELQQGTMTKSEVHLSQLAMEAMKERDENPGIKETLGLSTGSRQLDKAIGGLQDEQLIIIGARPAMGKTAVALSIAKHIGMTLKAPVALFSLEMSAKQLYTRFQTQVSGIESEKIKYNDLTLEEKQILFQADGKLAEAEIYIDDTPGLNIEQFRAKATIMKHKYGLKAILIDYLQLMSGSKGSFNREAEVSEISRKLKMVAKELGIPIVALCQLSRAVETRGGNKIPMLSDLRDSGSIEQDADTIMFLWRPEYYGHKDAVEFRHYGVDISPENLLAIIVAKQREGKTMIIPLLLQLNTMSLKDHPALEARPYDPKPKAIDSQKLGIQAGLNFGNDYVDPEDTNEDRDSPF